MGRALQDIDRAQLQGEERISWDILTFDAGLVQQADALLQSTSASGAAPLSADDSPLRVSQMSGPQLDLPQLLRATRFNNEADYRNYLARLGALPRYLDQLRQQLEAGRAGGWMPPRVAVQRLPGQFAPLLNADLQHNPLYAPLLAFPAEVPENVREQLRANAAQVLRTQALPALQGLRDYLAGTWVPAARDSLAARALPHGDAYYALQLQRYNTTRMDAQQIHALGLKEVARLDAALQAVMREAGFGGTLAEFRHFLRTDPRFQFTRAEDELAAFRDIAKRVDPLLPTLFVELPRLPYGIRAMSPEEGNNAPHYIRGAIDGSRAGYFEAMSRICRPGQMDHGIAGPA